MSSYGVSLVEVDGLIHSKELEQANALFPDSFLDIEDRQLKEGFWWLAMKDCRVVGFSGMVPFHPFGEWYGYLKRTGVVEECQGKGLQKWMIRECMQAAAKRTKWTHMISETWYENNASSNSFISEGFKLVSPERVWAKKTMFWKKEIVR